MPEQGEPSGSGGIRDRIGAMGDWQRAMMKELSTLPESLRTLRRSIDDLSAVVGRLEAVSEVVERTQARFERVGAFDAARQFDDAAAKLEEQMAQVRKTVTDSAPKSVQEAVEHMARSVAGMADLSAKLFQASWPRPDKRASSGPAGEDEDSGEG